MKTSKIEKRILKKFCGALRAEGMALSDAKGNPKATSRKAVSQLETGFGESPTPVLSTPAEKRKADASGEPISPAEHTRAPWKLQDFRGCIEITAYGQSVCEVAPYIESQIQTLITRKTGLANAAFIVTACNAHEALVDALRAIDKGFQDGSIKFTKKRQADSDPYHPANTLLCAALALVAGQ